MSFILVWGNFCEKDESAKNVNITPKRKFPDLQYKVKVNLGPLRGDAKFCVALVMYVEFAWQV